MDAQRQHDFVGGSNENRSRTIYCNMRKVQNTAPHTHFMQDRPSVSLERNKLCGCVLGMPDNMQCKGCRSSSAEKIWTASNSTNMSYRNMENQKGQEKSPIYMHPDVGAGPYWPDKAASFPEESLVGVGGNKTALDPVQTFNLRAYDKVYNVEQSTCKMPPQGHPTQRPPPQSQIRPPASIGYCEDRFFDDKYPFHNETRSPNVMYASSTVPAQNMDSCDPELNSVVVAGLRRTTIDNRSINPISGRSTSNNDQHQSTNYIRKCPQICNMDGQGSAYSNLYMSAPQFSSEKFTSIQPEKNVDFLTHSSAEMSNRNDSLKMCESLLRTNASPLPYATQNKYSPVIKEHMHHYMPQPVQVQAHMQHPHPHQQQQQQQQQQQLQKHATFSRHSLGAAVPAQYVSSQGTTKDHPNNGPGACKSSQSYDHYQYSRNSNSLPSTNIAPMKVVHGLTEYSSKEDTSLDPRAGSNSGNGLFLNPYTAPSLLSNTCCKGSSPLPTVISNLRHESPLDPSKCMQKYDDVKSPLEIVHNNPQYTSAPVPVSTPPSTANNPSRNFRRQTICYESMPPKCLERPLYVNASSKTAAATMAPNSGFQPQPPTPSHMLPTSHHPHQKSHHRQYSQQYSQSYSHSQPIDERPPAIVKANRKSTNHMGNPGPFDNQLQPPPPHLPCFSANRTLQTANTTLTPPAAITNSSNSAIGVSSTANQSSNHMKKSQATKPNYRELIKQVHAIRSAEDELNLQIIKKTMNVDARLNRAAVDANVQHLPMSNVQVWNRPPIAKSNSPELRDSQSDFSATNSSCRSDVETSLIRSDHLATHSHTSAQNKSPFGEKTSSSPLDLSMRTIKTKADSTDYKYQRTSLTSQTNRPSQTSTNTNYMYALPRVEFTPNFSLHTAKVSQSPIDEKPRIVEHVSGGRGGAGGNIQAADDVAKCIPIIKSKMEHLPFPIQKSPALEVAGLQTKPSQVLYDTTAFHPIRSELQGTTNSKNMVKSMPTNTTKHAMRGCQEMWQVRPSVLETNPYATTKALVNEKKTTMRSSSTTNVLTPDTSATISLVKSAVTSDCGSPNQALSRSERTDALYILPSPVSDDKTLAHETAQLGSTANSSSIGYVTDATATASYTDRKRSIEDNERACNIKPQVKQAKIEIATIATSVEEYRHTEVPVIVNEKVKAKVITEPAATFHQPPIININECKNEQVSPRQHTYPTYMSANIKSDTSTLIAARIRTKAELKGFTFIPPIAKSTDASPPKPTSPPMPLPAPTLRIKEEFMQTAENDMPSIPELNENFNHGSLLDFGWSSTCNNLVEQLLSNSKKPLAKKRPKNAEYSDENLTFVERKIKLQNIKVEDQANTDIKRINLTPDHRSTPLGDPLLYNVDSPTVNMDSNNIGSMPQSVLQKKISKVGRDKLREHQERRFAARVEGNSSSESDIELDRRKTERLKKPFKKLAKSRINTRNIKNRFSDCGSDSSGSEFEESHKLPINSNIKTKVDKRSTQAIVSGESSNCIQDDIKTATENVLKTTKTDQHSKKPTQSNSPKNVSNTSQSDDVKPDLSAKVKLEKNQEKEGHEKPSTAKKVQAANEKTKKNKKAAECAEQLIRQPNNQKIGQNTITRSKRKRELELQLANSKVLRNEKIIRNSTATKKIKRKYTRKFAASLHQGGVKNESLSKEMHSQLIMSTRLRSRTEKSKDNDRKALKKKKSNPQIAPNSNALKSTTHASTRNDGESDLLMEVYRYKRSLKVPPSLITLKHPSNKLDTALSDFETVAEMKKKTPQAQGQSTTTRIKASAPEAKAKQTASSTAGSKKSKQASSPEQPRSIIDVLHSRVLKSSSSKPKHTKTLTKKSSASTPVVENVNITEVHTSTSATATAELPTLKRDEESDTDKRKRHFSIFDTKVLQTKTRTESKLQQKREIIREIFVGEDRPASAPPEVTPSVDDGCVKMTYEQKYEQFLQQMNIVVNDTKFNKLSRKSSAYDNFNRESNDAFGSFPISEIKQEEDTESASAIDVDEKCDADVPADNASIASAGPIPNNFKRKRSGKYFRRKGSSGFDYIRKKKKPSSICSAALPNLYMSHKSYAKSEADFKIKDKTEDDVCREIQKWVLNKGVGQSTMHKAARLGYIDVIVYCLDRLCLNPDQKDNAGYTPLHEACTNGWLDIANILLQYGAKHSEAAHSGIRPLHEASENDHEEIVRLLLSYGADPLLATYSGQTPLMLASNAAVRDLLRNHLHDVQHVGTDGKPWHFEGPWKIFDANENGWDVLSGAPSPYCDMSRALCRNFGSNMTLKKKQCNQYEGTSSKAVLDKCIDLFDNISSVNSIRLFNNDKPEVVVDGSNSDIDSDSGLFEFEEADVLLPPLYLLSDEGTQKWVLLSDLCNLLKVKSKDTLLNKIYPSSSASPVHRGYIKELKMADFLKKATCLQLLCAGEKINICASKVVLIKYNENVRDLLGVKTILMKF